MPKDFRLLSFIKNNTSSYVLTCKGQITSLTIRTCTLYPEQLVFLFVVLRPNREFFTHLELSPFPVKSCNFFYLYSALMAIEQWGFFRVPHLLWHNGHSWFVFSTKLGTKQGERGSKLFKWRTSPFSQGKINTMYWKDTDEM